jgi:hypothetical protein
MSQLGEESDEEYLARLRIPESEVVIAKRPVGRGKKAKPFVQVELEAIAAANAAIGCPGATVMLYIRYLVWSENSSTVMLPNQTLTELGVSRDVKRRTLRRLEQAGLIAVERRGSRSPKVTLLVT